MIHIGSRRFENGLDIFAALLCLVFNRSGNNLASCRVNGDLAGHIKRIAS
jgi:hypothetical protein